jgi:hypothetical protein
VLQAYITIYGCSTRESALPEGALCAELQLAKLMEEDLFGNQIDHPINLADTRAFTTALFYNPKSTHGAGGMRPGRRLASDP